MLKDPFFWFLLLPLCVGLWTCVAALIFIVWSLFKGKIKP